jgi:hypothetical protein
LIEGNQRASPEIDSFSKRAVKQRQWCFCALTEINADIADIEDSPAILIRMSHASASTGIQIA